MICTNCGHEMKHPSRVAGMKAKMAALTSEERIARAKAGALKRWGTSDESFRRRIARAEKQADAKRLREAAKRQAMFDKMCRSIKTTDGRYTHLHLVGTKPPHNF